VRADRQRAARGAPIEPGERRGVGTAAGLRIVK
jgi:hypothetical protein